MEVKKSGSIRRVRIHLADGSQDRGQYQLLGQENFGNTLLSYHYRNVEEHFAQAWNELVRIHLAGQGPFTLEAKQKESVESFLLTYAYPKEMDKHNNLWIAADLRPRVIIDSGAFTAWSTSKIISPKDYAKWALDFDKRWRHKMASLYFMNLDVIGDQDASWKNQSILESLGMQPIPIITHKADKSHLLRALENYSYIALGGLVPLTRDKEALRKWLDHCFRLVMFKYQSTGILPKVHLLGITTDWVLKRYPCYSSDSSSWVACLRYGHGTVAGLKKIPKYNESKGAMAATLHVLRSEIRKYKEMERSATNLWNSRGIVFDNQRG